MNERGFSLIEIMIAVGLLTGMSLMIYQTLNQSLESKVRVEKQDETLHSVNIGFGKITADLTQAFLAHSSLKGKEASYETGMKGDGEKLHFSTLGHYHYIKNARDTDQVTVGYELKRNQEGQNDLTRRESLRLGEKIDEGGSSFVLIENVKELKFEYFDSNKREWVNSWDTSQVSVLGRLPQAVKLSLKVVVPDDEGSFEKGTERFYSTTAYVDLYQTEIKF